MNLSYEKYDPDCPNATPCWIASTDDGGYDASGADALSAVAALVDVLSNVLSNESQ